MGVRASAASRPIAVIMPSDPDLMKIGQTLGALPACGIVRALLIHFSLL
jgi:hypothetical protein